METFDYLYRKLAYATVGVLFGTLALFFTSVVCAVLGLAHAVAVFNGVTLALAYLFGALLLAFLATSLVRGLVHYLTDRRDAPG